MPRSAKYTELQRIPRHALPQFPAIHLSKADPVLGQLIKRIGPLKIGRPDYTEPYQALLSAVVLLLSQIDNRSVVAAYQVLVAVKRETAMTIQKDRLSRFICSDPLKNEL